MMNGTEWTEPGEGATIDEFVNAIATTRPPSMFQDSIELYRTLENDEGDPRLKTNLRLTGAPLTADDLERIAQAK